MSMRFIGVKYLQYKYLTLVFYGQIVTIYHNTVCKLDFGRQLFKITESSSAGIGRGYNLLEATKNI